jgi:hypothetical protein
MEFSLLDAGGENVKFPPIAGNYIVLKETDTYESIRLVIDGVDEFYGTRVSIVLRCF